MATRTNPGGYPGFIPPVTPPPASPTKANPPAVAASFRDWLVTHNWKLHRAGVALLAVSCLVRSFTRGDAAVDAYSDETRRLWRPARRGLGGFGMCGVAGGSTARLDLGRARRPRRGARCCGACRLDRMC
mgnify:CR=1 FL=1